MVLISLDEVLPAARESWEEHLAIIGTVSGMTVMVVSLWLLAGQDSPLAKLPEGIPS